MIPCSSLLVCGFGEGTGILPWSRGGFENGQQFAGSARERNARRYPAISVVAGGRTGPVSEVGRHPGVAGLLRGPPSFRFKSTYRSRLGFQRQIGAGLDRG